MKRKKPHDPVSSSTTPPSPSSPSTSAAKGSYKFVPIFVAYFVIALVVLGAAVGWSYAHKSPFTHKIITTKNGLFGKVSVVDDVSAGTPVRMLTYGRSILGGYWQVMEKPSCFTAFDVMQLALYAHPDPKKALVIGLGTGIFANKLARSGVKCDVVEIDPVVVQLAQKYFGFTTKGQIFTEDALVFMNRKEIIGSNQYDIVLHDIFSGDISTALFTSAVFRKFETSLHRDGIFALNFIGRPYSEACKSVYYSLSAIWEHVRCFADQKIDLSTDVPLTNMVFFASHFPVTFVIPPQFSKDAPIYSAEWVFTHHSELELLFSEKEEESAKVILTEENHGILEFNKELKDDFWVVMLGLFDEEAWKNILDNKAT